MRTFIYTALLILSMIFMATVMIGASHQKRPEEKLRDDEEQMEYLTEYVRRKKAKSIRKH